MAAQFILLAVPSVIAILADCLFGIDPVVDKETFDKHMPSVQPRGVKRNTETLPSPNKLTFCGDEITENP